VSKLWARPFYQSGLAPATGDCGAAAGCREVPDLSIDGDPATGYVASYDGAWHVVGGTSVGAPAIAAMTALAESSPACAGRRIGFLNPILYGPARGDLRDVTIGDNGYDGVSGFAASAGYDAASGLGTPTAGLGSALCASAGSGAATAARHAIAVRLGPQRDRTDRVGQRIHTRIAVRRPADSAVTFTAAGLPRGLRIDRRSGVIEGRPLSPGTRIVHVRVSGAAVAPVQATFRWKIDGRPNSRQAARRDEPRRKVGARR
jgi:hypothetical protein